MYILGLMYFPTELVYKNEKKNNSNRLRVEKRLKSRTAFTP